MAGSSYTRYVALMRGINLAGKNRISMPTLMGLFKEAGCRDISTFIQSGNILFSANPQIAAKAKAAVCKSILEQLDFKTQIVMRTQREWERAASSNPYVHANVHAAALYVMFLDTMPSAELLANLDPNRSPPDEYYVSESEIYLNLQTGAAKTKLTNAYFDSKLKTISTFRNWKTVQAIQLLLAGSGPQS